MFATPLNIASPETLIQQYQKIKMKFKPVLRKKIMPKHMFMLSVRGDTGLTMLRKAGSVTKAAN